LHCADFASDDDDRELSQPTVDINIVVQLRFRLNSSPELAPSYLTIIYDRIRRVRCGRRPDMSGQTAVNRLRLLPTKMFHRQSSAIVAAIDATSTCIVRMVALATVIVGMSLALSSNGVADAMLHTASGYQGRHRTATSRIIMLSSLKHTSLNVYLYRA